MLELLAPCHVHEPHFYNLRTMDGRSSTAVASTSSWRATHGAETILSERRQTPRAVSWTFKQIEQGSSRCYMMVDERTLVPTVLL